MNAMYAVIVGAMALQASAIAVLPDRSVQRVCPMFIIPGEPCREPELAHCPCAATGQSISLSLPIISGSMTRKPDQPPVTGTGTPHRSSSSSSSKGKGASPTAEPSKTKPAAKGPKPTSKTGTGVAGPKPTTPPASRTRPALPDFLTEIPYITDVPAFLSSLFAGELALPTQALGAGPGRPQLDARYNAAAIARPASVSHFTISGAKITGGRSSRLTASAVPTTETTAAAAAAAVVEQHGIAHETTVTKSATKASTTATAEASVHNGEQDSRRSSTATTLTTSTPVVMADGLRTVMAGGTTLMMAPWSHLTLIAVID